MDDIAAVADLQRRLAAAEQEAARLRAVLDSVGITAIIGGPEGIARGDPAAPDLRRTDHGECEREEQRFLLELSDTLRPLADAIAIQGEACRLIAERLRVDRAYYVEIDDERGVGRVARDHVESGPSLAGEHPIADFAWSVDILRTGANHAVANTQNSPLVPGSHRAALAAIEVTACMCTPLIKGGRLVGALCVTDAGVRTWTDAELELLREVGERIWAAAERARAEAKLRESERRFAQFAASSASALWIRDGATMALEYISPAVETIYGLPPEAMLGEVRHWAVHIVPEDREAALEQLQRARDGETVVHEFRIQRAPDRAFRWIRSTAFPLQEEEDGAVQRIGGIAEDVTEARLATEHSAILLAELQHRVRNILALTRAIVARTGERAASVPDYTALMSGRLMTLARVQALLTGGANIRVAVATIVEDEVSAQAAHPGQYDIAGDDIALAPKAAEVMTLAIHELATNAVKHGALSVPDGRVTVRWATFERKGSAWLRLDWSEAGAPSRCDPDAPAPRRQGFGSELIEGRIPYELGGRGEIAIERGGARCRLEFPLREGDSILETDAPQRASVFGGMLDMTGHANLDGHRILIVEDDYYIASDMARAVEGAGGEVLGPCPSEDRAQGELGGPTPPTGAILDINTGAGPSFALAAELRRRGVPFLFVTGYDMTMIPAEFDGVARLQKPVDVTAVVDTLAQVVGAAERQDEPRSLRA